MKVKINKDRAKNIALMSIPAVGLVVISLPLAVLAAIVGGSMLTVYADDEYEIELSFSQWTKIIQAQHATEEERKRLATLYWRYHKESE